MMATPEKKENTIIVKYLFGDSTEFPLQRDFLGMVDDFLDTSVKAVTLENTVLDLKEAVIERRRFKHSVMDELDNFILTVENAISGAVTGSKEQETIARYGSESRDYLKKFIEDGKTKFSDEVSQEIMQLEEKITNTNQENRKVLESFFMQDPIPINIKKYTIKAVEKGHSTKVQVDCEGDISYSFDIASIEVPFWKSRVKAHDFVKGVEIPARMKKPLLKKEIVPDIVNIDDYFLGDLNLCGKELEVVFKKRPENSAGRFRLKMKFNDEFEVAVYHADEKEAEKNIQEVAELKNLMDISKLRELGEKIIEKVNDLYAGEKQQVSLCLGDKDVLEDNFVFDLMQKVAELMAPCVAEIKKHSPSTEELSLKAEDESGKRSEIYLKKSHAREKLGELKEKGDRIFETLDLK